MKNTLHTFFFFEFVILNLSVFILKKFSRLQIQNKIPFYSVLH